MFETMKRTGGGFGGQGNLFQQVLRGSRRRRASVETDACYGKCVETHWGWLGWAGQPVSTGLPWQPPN